MNHSTRLRLAGERLMLEGERLMALSRMVWMDDAACAGADPGIWDTDVTPDQSIARTICAGCPVVAACAVAAKAARATHGTWAGVDMRPPRWQKVSS